MVVMTILIALILCFPLVGFLLLGIGFKHIPARITKIIAPGTILISFLLSVHVTFFTQHISGPQIYHLFSWISIGRVTINFDLLIDPLTCLMLLIITGIGFLIHVYSVAYMKGDEGLNRFFACMNLFVFSMLLLVMASNYAIMFIGWEGVGLCSYLLIGFWYKNQNFNNAAKKAFIMNRIGDLGFLLGMFLLFTTFGSLDFMKIFQLAKNMPAGSSVLITITLLLLLGAVGKSAQIPLFTWLPDAMAGPTPVSALIHAATMVTAGVYMVARSNILFVLAPPSMLVIIFVGLITALFSAIIAVYQNDIKKILAYSTISQLGFMFMALGLGAFTGAMFHLTTHAFFKALLFLGAGSVIHALKGEQDIRKMGGLRRHLPKTWWTFLIGTISIAGIPPLAGFFSKDEILNVAFGRNFILWVFAIAGVLLTAFYMFRMLFLVFSGTFRGSVEKRQLIKESSNTMIVPMIILAFFSFFGGLISMPEFTGISSWMNGFLYPVFSDSLDLMRGSHPLPDHLIEILLAGVTTITVIFVILISYSKYGKNQIESGVRKEEKLGIRRLLENKFYVDELYDSCIVKPLMHLSDILYRWVEEKFIDRIINGIGNAAVRGGNIIRFLQTGHVGFYLFVMVFGIIAILLFNIVLR